MRSVWALVVAQACLASPAAAITGGQPQAVPGANVAIVLTSNGGFVCTGALIGPQSVATTDTCVGTKPAIYQVIAGSASATPAAGSQVSAVTAIRSHPHLNAGDNVVVLTLATPIAIVGGVSVATIPPAGFTVMHGSPARFTGYGAQAQATPPVVGTLFGFDTAVYAPGECGGANRAVKLCTRSATGGACVKDAGSPLMANGVLLGLNTGYETACQGASTAFFMNVTAPEISQFLAGNDNPPIAPRVTTAGTITVALARAGQTATCQPAVLTAPATTVTYRFYDAKSLRYVGLGNGPTHRLSSSDVGRTLRCEMHAGNAGGSLVLGSGNTIGPVTAAPAPTRLGLRLLSHSSRVDRGGRVTARFVVTSSRPTNRQLTICVRLGRARPCIRFPRVVPGAVRRISAQVPQNAPSGRKTVQIVASAPGALSGFTTFHFQVVRRRPV